MYYFNNSNALNTITGVVVVSGYIVEYVLEHVMLAGITSSTTFKIRAGPSGASTVTFNGNGGSRLYGGVMGSSLKISEIAT